MKKPLTPPDCDLRSFAFMPLDVVRLRDSDIAALTNGEEFRAAVLLWCASWHQIPAASLPNDDMILAQLAGFGRVVKEWKKVRNGALRGWILCSDGRLYHPVIAEKAIDSWNRKLEQAWKTECARIKKHNQRHEDNPLPMPTLEEFLYQGTKKDCPQGQQEHVPDLSTGKRDPIDIDRDMDREIPKDTTGDNKHTFPVTRVNVDPPSPGILAAELIKLGVKVTSMHPNLLSWIEKGITLELAIQAVQIARQSKPNGDIPAKYLNTVIENEVFNRLEKISSKQSSQVSLEEKNLRAVKDWVPPGSEKGGEDAAA